MYEHLEGKKLLVIGSDTGTMGIIDAAREMGLYIIACDGVTDYSKAPAKRAADEAWDMDYSDFDAVAERCKAAGVDGVFAGYSEFRVHAACMIANRLGLPFYATEEQIDLTRNKRKFKDECSKYGVPIPRDYCFSYPMSEEDKDKIEYPVIVKPADYAGRKGISICFDRQQLDKAVEYAVSKSVSRTVIVEDYLDGLEFSSVYTVSDGKISLSCVNEKYITDDQEVKSGLCEFLISPAKSYERYLRETDSSLRAFLKGIDIRNGVAFFQGMITDKKICVFEMGYRINGNNDFKVIERQNGLSFMKMMIAYSLCGDMCDDISKDNPVYDRYVCTMPLYVHAGTIGKIEYSPICSHPDISDVTVYGGVGKVVAEDGSTGQKMLTMKLSGKTLEEVAQTVNFIHKNVVVEDTDGRNMLFKPFDSSQLFK